MTRKEDYLVPAWGELCHPVVIIIHSTNIEVAIIMRNKR